MSRKSQIRWNEADSKELARTVKNFNAKVTRLEKKYAHRADVLIPEKVSASELKELITTRRDLQREIKSLQRFSKRGAEELVEMPTTKNAIRMTEWQKKEMSLKQGIINRQRSARYSQIKDIEIESGGKGLGYSLSEFGMGTAEKASLLPVKAFTEGMDKYSARAKFRSLRKHAQSDYFDKSDARLLENFTKSIEETFGEEKSKELVDAIKNMSFKEFYNKFKANPGMFEITSPKIIRELGEVDLDDYLEHLKSTWMPE